LRHHNADSVFVRQEPYVWASGVLALNGATPIETTVQGNDTAQLVVIEVDDSAAVRYELNPNGPLATNHRNASVNSPKLTGTNVFQWFAGATLSFVDAGVTG